MHSKITSVFSAAFLAAALIACGDDDPMDPPGPEAVAINFQAQVNGAAFACGTSYDNVGTSNTTITPVDFRFYVHDVRLVTSAGSEVPVELTQDGQWQREGLALLDFED
ncbi:MAG: MbnP family protein, partial [Longimicrobiales bacterium]